MLFIKWFFKAKIRLAIFFLISLGIAIAFDTNMFVGFLITGVLGAFYYYIIKRNDRKKESAINYIAESFDTQLQEANRRQNAKSSDDMISVACQFLKLIEIDITFDEFRDRCLKSERYFSDRGITESLVWTTCHDIAREKNKAFELDWKWGMPEDVIRNHFSKLNPPVHVKVTNSERKGDKIRLECTIEGVGYSGEFDNTIPHSFFDSINPSIEKAMGYTFISYNTGGDSHGFIFAPLMNKKKLLNTKYSKIFSY